MPRITTTPADLQNAVERRVAMDVAKQLVNATALNPADIVISFPGDENPQPMYNSRGVQDVGVDRAHFGYFDKWSIVVTEEYDESAMLTMFTQENDAPLLFHDAPLGIKIRPIYSDTTVNISVTFRCNSHREVQHWRDWLRTRINENCNDFIFESHLYITMPKDIAAVLYVLHNLRESNAGYGDTFAQWLKKCTNDRLTVLSNQIGEAKLLGWGENQTGILGTLDFDIPPKEVKQEGGNIYELTFDYKFTYAKPIRLVLDYPLVVHSQLIPESIFQRDQVMDYWRIRGVKGDLNARFDYFRTDIGFGPEHIEGIRNPYYDEWAPKSTIDGYSALLTTLICPNLDNPHVVGDIRDFVPYSLTEEFLAYAIESRSYITRRFKCPFLLALYVDDELVHEELLTLGDDYLLRSSVALDPRRVYHLRLLHLIDPSRLDPFSADLLRKKPKICLAYLRGLAYLIIGDKDIGLDIIGNGTLVTRASYQAYISALKKSPLFLRWGPERLWALINFISVKTEGDAK